MSSLYAAVDITDKNTLSMLNYCQVLAKQKVPGDYVDNQTFHITIDFLNNDETDNDLVQLALKKFKDNYADEFKSFYVFAEGLYRFDGGACWMGVHQSFKLYKMKYIFNKLLKEVGYKKAEESFDGYTPHITFAFNTPEFEYMKLARVPIPIDNLTIWNSPKMNGSYVTNVLYKIDL